MGKNYRVNKTDTGGYYDFYNVTLTIDNEKIILHNADICDNYIVGVFDIHNHSIYILKAN